MEPDEIEETGPVNQRPDRNPRFNRQKNIKESRENPEAINKGKKRGGVRTAVGVSVFLMAITVAILFDIAGVLFEILPGIGGLLVTVVVTPLGFIILWGLYALSGKKLNPKSKAVIGVCFIIECIPVINALPGLTTAVIASAMSESAGNFVSKNT